MMTTKPRKTSDLHEIECLLCHGSGRETVYKDASRCNDYEVTCFVCDGVGTVTDTPDYEDCHCHDCHHGWWVLSQDTDIAEDAWFANCVDAQSYAIDQRNKYDGATFTVCCRSEDNFNNNTQIEKIGVYDATTNKEEQSEIHKNQL